MYNVYRNKVRKLCKSARQSYYDKKILNTSESNPKKWYDNIKSISGLSKSEPFSSIFHDGEFKRGPELAELIAESFCAVSNELAPLCFNKLHITSVPDEYIISTQQVEIELEKISLQKAIGPDDIPNWALKSAAPLLAGPICSIFNAKHCARSHPDTLEISRRYPSAKNI
jgi:hypothetical protein